VLGPGALAGVPPPDDGHQLPSPLEPKIYFEDHPGYGIAVELRGGIGLLARSEARGAFAFGGGLLRGHYNYFEFGGFYDQGDDAPSGGSFSHVGGLLGAWLPYHNWVDFEVALGFGVRRYDDPDPRYGPNGYELSTAALSLVAGVSDRSSSGNLGGRIGGQIILTNDLTQRDQPWKLYEQNNSGEVVETTGTTHVGGFSIALAVTLGLDYGEAP